MTTSASVGTSYGSLMPVNSLMMPARALAYRPLRSRFSHSSTLVLTCTRMKPPWGAIIARTSLRMSSYGAIGAQTAMPRCLVISDAT